MMEYTDKYWKMLMPYLKKSLNRRYGKEYTKDLMKNLIPQLCWGEWSKQ